MKTVKGKIGNEERLKSIIRSDLAPYVQKYSISVFGKEFKNKRALCEYYGINFNSLNAQLYLYKKELEEAIKYLLDKEPLIFEGVIYKSITELAFSKGISPSIVHTRISRGKSLYEALSSDFSIKGKPDVYVYKGKMYQGSRDLFESHGISKYMFYYIRKTALLEKQLSPVEVLELYETFLSQYKGNRPTMLRTIPFVIYNDTWFPTLKDFCMHVGIEITAINALLNSKCKTHLDAFRYCKSATFSKFTDVATGKVCMLKDLKIKYKEELMSGQEDKYILTETVLRYPGLRFEEPTYWATPELDFKQFMKEL